MNIKLYVPNASLRNNGHIAFNKKAVTDFRLDQYDEVKFSYDWKKRHIIVSFYTWGQTTRMQQTESGPYRFFHKKTTHFFALPQKILRKYDLVVSQVVPLSIIKWTPDTQTVVLSFDDADIFDTDI